MKTTHKDKGEKKTIIFYAWLSTRGEKKHYSNGALYAGYVRDIPDKYRYLLPENEIRQYCVIS